MRGLVNEGHTCYVNAMLQSLYHIKAFRQIIYWEETESWLKSPIFWLKYIFYHLDVGGMPKIRTIEMIRNFKWPKMLTEDQYIHEFLSKLIEKIRESPSVFTKERLSSLSTSTLRTTIRCPSIRYSNSVNSWFDDKRTLDSQRGIEP